MLSLSLRTPLIFSSAFEKILKCKVWLKMECYQPTGSFKARGIGHLAQYEVHSGKKRLVASSGGNAGLAVAYAAHCLGVSASVVVPEATGVRARELMTAFNAEVLVHGASWQEAHEYAQTLLDADSAYIHPFDHPLIWAGHARMVEEIAEDLSSVPSAFVLSVGGGGLLSGVCEGMARVGWNDIPILAIETEGAASFAAAREAGKLVMLDKITSVATTLGAKRVALSALEWTKKHPIENITVSDCHAVESCYRFLDDHRVLVEPACGAALSPLYDSHKFFSQCEQVVVIVCGGAGITLDALHNYRHQCGYI
jgi:L-serine/L-threonine ammonia-lyase